jgi:hypothetical protein
MTHVTELALAAALVAALGLGALAVLPPSKPASRTTVALERTAAPVRRAEPSAVPSDAERIERLQQRIAAIKAEQRALAKTLRDLARERSKR